MVVDMYIIDPKKDQDQGCKRPTNDLFLVLVLFGLGSVQLQSFASSRTGLSNTSCVLIILSPCSNS